MEVWNYFSPYYPCGISATNMDAVNSGTVTGDTSTWNEVTCDDRTPMVISENEYGLNLGIYGRYTADVLTPEYDLPVYWMYRNKENFLVLNPRVWLTVAKASATGALFLLPLELWFEFAFTGMEGSPFEYQAMWSLDNRGHYC